MADKIHYNIRISGRVQGVGFRWNAASEARIIGIRGIVRNLDDGSVYIEAEGTREQIDAYLHWCKRGPALSRVDNIEIESAIPENYSDFRIEH